MWDFDFQAINAQGDPINGRLTAENAADAMRQLADQDLEVTAIQRIDTAGESRSGASFGDLIPDDNAWRQRLLEVVDRRHLWLPIFAELLQELPADAPRRATEQRLKRLESDLTVEQFLGNPEGASLLPLLTSQPEPGVDSQPARQWLEQLYCAQQKRSALRGWWTYPLILLFITLCMLIFFSVFMLPVFREMFNDFGLRLSTPTKWAFWLADQVTIYAGRTLLYVAVGCLLAIPVVRWWRKHAFTNRLFGRLVAGSTGNLRAMARLTGTLAELLGLDVPRAAALRYAGQASGHRYFADAAVRTAEKLQRDRFQKQAAVAGVPVDPTGRLPQSVVHALAAGAGGSASQPLLRELAAIYTHVAQLRSARLGGSLPVISLLVVGGFVGFIIVSLFMPLVSMVTSLSS